MSFSSDGLSAPLLSNLGALSSGRIIAPLSTKCLLKTKRASSTCHFFIWLLNQHFLKKTCPLLSLLVMPVNFSNLCRANAQISPEAMKEQVADLERQREHFESVIDKSKHDALVERGDRRLSFHAMQAALLITLYQDEPILQTPNRLLSILLDIDELMTSWRMRHALMVHRMLGVKIGTGGSSGYHYLRASAAKHSVFKDLFSMSTFLIPRFSLPPLPEEIASRMSFATERRSIADADTSSSSSASAAASSDGGPLERGAVAGSDLEGAAQQAAAEEKTITPNT